MRVVLVILLALVGASPAVAQPKKERKQAEVLFDAGEQAYRNAEFALAAKYFEQAYEQLPAPEIAFSAAQAYRLAYQKDQKPEYVSRAIELYDLYQKQVQKGPQVADALAHLGRLRGEWHDLVVAGKATDDRVRVSKSQISVLVPARIKDAKVKIDGKPAVALEYIDVEPGEHTVEVEAPGYASFRQQVKVANSPLALPAELVPRPAQIKIASEDGIHVAIDGRAVDVGRDGTVEVPFGKRYLTITRRGRRPFARELELEPGALEPIDAELVPTTQRRVAKGVLLASGVLLGVTALTLTLALTADSRATERAQAGIKSQADADHYTTWRKRRDIGRSMTIGFGSATMVVGLAALALYLFDNPEAEATAPLAPAKRDETKFTPMAFVGGYGLGVTGWF